MDRRYLAIVLPLNAILLAAAAWADGLTLHQIARLRTAEEVAFSPDAQVVAVVVEVPRRPLVDPDGPAWNELHLVDLHGKSRPFVTGEVKVEKISWRPGTGEIAFLAKRGDDKTRSLYAIPRHGGEARQLLTLETDLEAYAFSRDGQRVALLAKPPLSPERQKREDQGFNQKVVEEDWLPNAVWVANLQAAGAEPQRIPVDGAPLSVLFSPAGQDLVLKVAPTSLVDDELMKTRVRVIDAQTGEVKARIDNPGKIGEVAISPAGGFVALIAAADLNDPREGRLWVVPTSGGTPRDLVPGLRGHVTRVVWQDERHLLFLADEGVDVRLGQVDRESGAVTTVLPLGGPNFTELSRAENGALALIGATSQHPEEVFHLAPGRVGTPAVRLTDLNPWLAEVRLAAQEVIRYPARDGLEIEGLLIRPLAEQREKRYPLVVIVHGGPESHFKNGWLTAHSRPGQTLAARGFAVLYPNYRGSTGRGVEFSKLDHADPAGREFDDLVDGVDHLIASGLVDRDRVGIVGGSYGGYAAAWGATYYSERYAAAVMEMGVSDNISMIGSSDIPIELYEVHERKWPWQDWQHFRDRSPLHYVSKAKTPLLIVHGEADTRVSPDQSRILYRYLKLLGQAPVRLVLYPGEGHGNRRAASRLDLSLRLVQWLEHYLKAPGTRGSEPPPFAIAYEE